MFKDYKISSRNSTVCGYSGRDFDWLKFCWDESQIHKAIFKGDKNMRAPKVYVDDGLIAPNCQYLHVPYDWEVVGTIYRVRPNESMRAGQVYRDRKILRQNAIKKEDGWYWRLEFEDGK